MAHLWDLDEHNQLVAARVDDGALVFGHARLHSVAGPPDAWVLLCPVDAGVHVNGEPVPLGLVVLSDRDELRIPGQPPRFFSTETIACVELFPETTRGGCCPRCRQTIECGTSAVCCPSCGLWHHASHELPCWTYAPTCAACAQDTSPDAGFRWTPEEL
jgi:hypothetical protein